MAQDNSARWARAQQGYAARAKATKGQAREDALDGMAIAYHQQCVAKRTAGTR